MACPGKWKHGLKHAPLGERGSVCQRPGLQLVFPPKIWTKPRPWSPSARGQAPLSRGRKAIRSGSGPDRGCFATGWSHTHTRVHVKNKLRRYPQQQRFLVLAPPRSPRRTPWNPRGTLVEPSWNPRGTLPQGRPGSPRSLCGLRPQSFQLLGKNKKCYFFLKKKKKKKKKKNTCA